MPKTIIEQFFKLTDDMGIFWDFDNTEKVKSFLLSYEKEIYQKVREELVGKINNSPIEFIGEKKIRERILKIIKE